MPAHFIKKPLWPSHQQAKVLASVVVLRISARRVSSFWKGVIMGGVSALSYCVFRVRSPCRCNEARHDILFRNAIVQEHLTNLKVGFIKVQPDFASFIDFNMNRATVNPAGTLPAIEVKQVMAIFIILDKNWLNGLVGVSEQILVLLPKDFAHKLAVFLYFFHSTIFSSMML